jgi:hypothetical protein
MSGAPLYALAASYQQLLEQAEEGGDVEAALASLDDAIQAKCLGIVRVLAQLDADEAAASAEAVRLAGRAKAFAGSAEKLRQYLKDSMKQAGITRVKSPAFSITTCPGQPKVVITDVKKVPPELMRQPKVPDKEPDKVAILKWHTATGEVPPGCDIVETTKLMVR